MKTTCCLGLALALSALAAVPARSAVITQWDFQNPPDPVAVNNSPAPTIGAGTVTPLGMNIYPTPNIGVTTCDVLNGVAGDTGSNGVANTSQIWRVRAQAAAGGGAANGWSSLAPIGTQGAEFAASTVGFNGPINVSFDWYATNQGEAKLQLEYTTDGVTFKNVPINVGTDTPISALDNAVPGNTVVGAYVWGSPAGQGQNWYTGLTATINDPAAAKNPNFAIEMVNAATDGDNVSMVGGALNNSSGNWRFDNVTISGTAVPEPRGIVLAGLAMFGLALVGANRSRLALARSSA